MEIEAGAKTTVALATIGEDGPNGAYIHMGKPLPWSTKLQHIHPKELDSSGTGP